jgi:hypothetical protein
VSADDVSLDSDRSIAKHDVIFNCGAYKVTLTELVAVAYLLPGFIGQLKAFFRDCPQDLKARVAAEHNRLQPVKGSVTGPRVSPLLGWFVDELCSGTLTVSELVTVLASNPGLAAGHGAPVDD